VRLFNTLGHAVQTFEPVTPPEVRMYVCGITPYDETHLGHGRCYVVFDLLRRLLARRGFRVTTLQNFTDIDDKILTRAREEGVPPAEIAGRYIASYHEAERRLNILPADRYPRVTDHISDIIVAVTSLVKRGYAYVTPSGVYFDLGRFPFYGRLSGRNREDLVAGARVEPDETKRSPMDFAVWKSARDGDAVSWDSPWGKGRPGWHIECSVMSMKYLGETLDVHGGGQDLIFPHHENEIAQSEALTGKPFARYWVHNGFVTINSQKMSKSLKNSFSLTDIFAMHDPMVVRLFLLSQHYRQPLDYSDQELRQFAAVYQRLRNARDAALFALGTGGEGRAVEERARAQVDDAVAAFDRAMDDDLNTSAALGALHAVVGILNGVRGQGTTGTLQYVYGAFRSLLDALGIALPDAGSVPDAIAALVARRQAARAARNFAEADRIRAELAAQGYTVEDTSNGPFVRRRS